MNLLPREGTAFYSSDFFSQEESDSLKQRLLSEIEWKQDKIKIFGRECLQPRLTAWYGDPGINYTYSGLTMCALPWTESLLTIKKRIEAETGFTFNSVLLNLYRNGEDSMGWHSDDEKELGPNPVIASVSFGAERTFKFRHKRAISLLTEIELSHGSLLLMKDETQHFWQHSLPKRKRVTEARINLTFRSILST